MNLHPVDLKTLTPEIFNVFKAQPPLLSAGNRTQCNTMTIGWAQMGTLWGLPVCTVYVRPERHTYRFMEENEYFTVSVLPTEAKETVAFCGTKSGRDVDKVRQCNLTLCYGEGEAPFFDEAEWVLVCKKIYVQDMKPECVLDQKAILPFYGERGGWHRIYTGLVVEAYTK